MILINVLMFVGIAASVVMLMISGEDAALAQAIRMREAERARAIARGGEMSAIAALRRDMVEGPDSDDATEPWAQIGERDRAIEGGRMSIAIVDAQSRFNVNALRDGSAEPVFLFRRIAAAAGVPDETATRAVELVRLYGPVGELRPLAAAGFVTGRGVPLEELLTALPQNGEINLNSASEALMAVVLASPVPARQLAERRRSRGMLTPRDFDELGILVPKGAGFTSKMFWVRTSVTIGGTTQHLTSLILRSRDIDQRPLVRTIGRWTGRATPVPIAGA